jgi:hypothetical protein
MLRVTPQFLIVMIAPAINDRLQRRLDYVEEERRILWEQVEALTGGKKHSFSPSSGVVLPRQASCSRQTNVGRAATS